MDDLMDKINLWGSDDDDYESEVSEDATTEATVLTTKAPSHTTEQDSSGDDAGLAFNALFIHVTFCYYSSVCKALLIIVGFFPSSSLLLVRELQEIKYVLGRHHS